MKSEFVKKSRLIQENCVPAAFDGFEFQWITRCSFQSVLSIRNAPHVLRQMASPNQISLEEHARFIDKYADLDRVDFILFDAEKGEPVGGFSLVMGEYGVEIGKYLGNQAYLGKGLGLRATSRLLDFARDALGLEVVYARTRQDNAANIRLNSQLGFVKSAIEDSRFLIMDKTL